jgi:hypothetical protein
LVKLSDSVDEKGWSLLAARQNKELVVGVGNLEDLLGRRTNLGVEVDIDGVLNCMTPNDKDKYFDLKTVF